MKTIYKYYKSSNSGKIILTTLAIVLSIQATGNNGARGAILCSIEKKRVSIFINSIWDDAETVCEKYDLPIGLLIAQACLESGFGRSYLANNKCNFLGIKYEGVYADFESKLHCFESWAKVLNQTCYRGLEFKTLEGWIYQLSTCGYAESKEYSSKLKSIIKKYNLNWIAL